MTYASGQRPVKAFKASDETVSVPIHIDPKQKLVALGFKIQTVDNVGTLTYTKVYQVGF